MKVEKSERVLILGGGLAGLAAACELADCFCVILIEQKPYLGGRASSFYHKRIGEEIDIGQHVFMRCCSHYIEFLRKLNLLDEVTIQPKLKVKLIKDGRVGVIKGSLLPGPFYLLPSFLKYPFLPLKDKLRVFLGMWAIKLTDRNQEGLTKISFYDWLIKHHQNEKMVEFWDFFVLPTLNDRVRGVSAQMGLMVLQEAFLKAHGADIGYPTSGLSKLISNAVVGYLTQRGGQVLLGSRAKSLLIEGRQVKGVRLSNGRVLDAEIFVSALSVNDLLRILPEEFKGLFAQACNLKWNPILNLHIWFDRPVMDSDFIAFLNSPLQWVFNKTKILGSSGPGQYLCLSLSGAWEYMDMSPEEIFQKLVAELRELLGAKEAKVKKYLVTKQRRATISTAPGMERYRLSSHTLLENFFIAGDWTATGWPSTMEGAVRSGEAAAWEIKRLLSNAT